MKGPELGNMMKAAGFGWTRGMMEMALKMHLQDGRSVTEIAEEVGKPEEEVRAVLGIDKPQEKSYEEALQHIEKQKQAGKSMPEIARLLNDAGYRTKTGKLFTAGNVWVLAKNEVYQEEPQKPVADKCPSETPAPTEPINPPMEQGSTCEGKETPSKPPETIYLSRQLYGNVRDELLFLRSRRAEIQAQICTLDSDIKRLEKLEEALKGFVEVAS
jgi:hypothetical protein